MSWAHCRAPQLSRCSCFAVERPRALSDATLKASLPLMTPQEHNRVTHGHALGRFAFCHRRTHLVRGSYSARVPRSSFARVRSVLFPHTRKKVKTRRMKRKMGEKMDSKEWKGESWRVSRQPHHERMRMG